MDMSEWEIPTGEADMAKYLLTVHHNYDNPWFGDKSVEEVYADVDAFNKSIEDIEVFGGGLQHPNTAAVVTNRGGSVVTTDGPFIETKESVGGFWVIEVPDRETALEVAGRATTACAAPVEVRPFEDGE